MDVNQSSLGIDITDLQVKSFVKSESHRVDGPKEGPHPQRGGGVDDGVDLFDREHFGQGIAILQFEHREDVPVTLAGDAEEELDAREGDAERTVSELSFVFEMQEEASDLGLGDLIGLAFGELGELPDRTEVAIVGACRLTGQVQIIAHLLVEFLSKEFGGGL